MICPNCGSENTLIKVNTYYICDDCVEPKFKPEDVENKIVAGISYTKTLKGYRILFDCDRIKGLYKVDYINNNLDSDKFQKNDTINDYHLVDKNNKSAGALRIYSGDYQDHYYTYLKNGDYIMLDKEDFTIFVK